MSARCTDYAVGIPQSSEEDFVHLSLSEYELPCHHGVKNLSAVVEIFSPTSAPTTAEHKAHFADLKTSALWLVNMRAPANNKKAKQSKLFLIGWIF